MKIKEEEDELFKRIPKFFLKIDYSGLEIRLAGDSKLASTSPRSQAMEQAFKLTYGLDHATDDRTPKTKA